MLTVGSLFAQTNTNQVNTNNPPQPGYHWEGTNQVLNAPVPHLLEIPDTVTHEGIVTTNDWTKEPQDHKTLATPWIVGRQLHVIGYPVSNYLCITKSGVHSFTNVEASSNLWMTMSNLPVVVRDLVYGTNNEIVGYKP
jgi:hypothetical protein